MPTPNRSTLLLLIGMIVLAAVARLLPHWPNFTPIGAMALFGASKLPRKWMAWVVPFAALYASDVALNNIFYGQYYEGFYLGFNTWVYVGFAVSIMMGFGLLRNREFNWLRLGGVTLGSTAVFFLLTNFGAWLGSPVYPQTTAGLMAAFTAGLPFLLNSVAGNLFFAGVLFGGAQVVLPRPDLATESV